MIEAMIKNKLKPDEDCLTSTVWGLLKYRSLRPILARFLAGATLVADNRTHLEDRIPESHLKAEKVKILFWKAFSPFGEPDIVLLGEDFALVVEAKYGAGLSGRNQLRKYGRLLNEKYPRKRKRFVIYLTADWVAPRLSKGETAGIDESLWWLSWHELSLLLCEASNKNLFAQEVESDLIQLLDHLFLGFFRGFSLPIIDLPNELFWRDRVPIISHYDHPQSVRTYFWKEEL
jgi:hypothetical protein